MQLPISVKHVQISRAQSTILIVVVVATVITVFSLVSAKALISQGSYQKRVLNARRDAVKQLRDNVNASKTLITQYNNVFEGSNPTNIIGGKNTTKPKASAPDGDNARIVLDALPSSYDFPALISSIAKILSDDNIANPSVTGTDQSDTIGKTSSVVNSALSTASQPVPITLTVSGTSSYKGIQRLIGDFGRVIRPFDTTNVQLSGKNSAMTFSMGLTTYYQPAKELTIGSKEIH